MTLGVSSNECAIHSYSTAKKQIQKQKELGDALVRESDALLAKPLPLKTLFSKGATFEEAFYGGKEGFCSRLNGVALSCFTHIDTIQDAISSVSLVGLGVSHISRKMALNAIERRIKAFRSHRESLPKTKKVARKHIQGQILALSSFLKKEKVESKKTSLNELKASLSPACRAVRFGCHLAKKILSSFAVGAVFGLVGNIAGFCSGIFRFEKGAREFFSPIGAYFHNRRFGEKLSNTYTIDVSRQISSPTMLPFKKELSAISRLSSIEKQGEEIRALKKKVRDALVLELKKKNVPDAEGRADLLAHIQMRKWYEEIAVRKHHSIEEVRRNECFTSSIKNGLVNLAIAKQQMEKKICLSQLLFHGLGVLLSIGDLVRAVLLFTGLLVASVSPFIALGLFLAGALLWVGSTLYSIRVRPRVFAVEWCSSDAWLGGLRKIQGAFLEYRLAQAEKKLAAVDEKHVLSQKEREMYERRVQIFTGQLSSLQEKTAAFQERCQKAYELDHLTRMNRQSEWQGLEERMKGFTQAIAHGLVEGNRLSPFLLQDLCAQTGVRFETRKMDEILSNHTMSKSEKEEALFNRLSPSISSLLARAS